MGVFEALAIVAGVAGIWLWNLSRAVNNLTYIPDNITGFSLGPPPLLTTGLIVQNTSNIDFTVHSISANVTTDGTLIGYISDFTPVTIPANSQRSVPLTLILQPLGVVNTIISIINGGVGSRNIAVDGTMNASGVQLPLSLSWKVGV